MDYLVYHKLSTFSILDSEAKMEDYILEADKKGITTICFTDHVDLNTNLL